MEQIAAGSSHDNEGPKQQPIFFALIPPDPKYLKSTSGYQNWGLLYRVEYETSGTPLDHSYDRNMPCALCQVYGRTNKVMIPSHFECLNGWRGEYYRYLELMAGYHGHKAALLPSTPVWIRV